MQKKRKTAAREKFSMTCQCYFFSGLVLFNKFCMLYVLTQLSISEKKSCVTFVLPLCCIRTRSTPLCVRNNGIDVDL